MLPAQHRLRVSADFAAVMRRRGQVSAGAPVLVLHAASRPDRAGAPGRVGFVVGKAVGNAVIRNRTTRRLREQCRARLTVLLPGVDYVVRARPAAAKSSSAALGTALDETLTALGPRWSRSA